ncbi:tetratricopeptide repeat protein [Nocardioides carbamazepini]|uniref:tetratricopeptide repeat protein n=1 Tax=Nocardioides carbamazepini TaxID=2854259 RepID=UPI00214A5226|nr:tetratricopeptide repeat protein [Nocardioides carbamazepini]MCR1784596.1 tetratricopeptide repeat protein [Nocardioides carbamazepini]
MPTIPARRHPRTAAALGALALVGAVLLGGCGGGNEDGGGRPADTASSSASAADTLVATGLERISAGDLDGAREIFAAVLVLDPANAYAHYNLGFLAQDDGDVATAIDEYNQALTTDPEFAPALYNLALLTEQADLDTAVDLYRRVLDVKPDDAATHMRLGFALRHLGREDEAATLLAQGIELDPAMKDVPAPSYAG